MLYSDSCPFFKKTTSLIPNSLVTGRVILQKLLSSQSLKHSIAPRETPCVQDFSFWIYVRRLTLCTIRFSPSLFVTWELRLPGCMVRFILTVSRDYHRSIWGVPLAITIAAVSLQKIGYDASEVSVGWCWVSIQEEDHVLWMLLTAKIWELLAYVTLPVLYILIKRHIHKAHTALSEYRPILSNNSLLPSMADRKLTLIPIIFIALRIWSTIRFLLLLINSPARQNPLFVTLHGIGNSFQGAANCIMFVLCTRPVRTRLVALLCCRRRDTPSGSDIAPQHISRSRINEPCFTHSWDNGAEDEEE